MNEVVSLVPLVAILVPLPAPTRPAAKGASRAARIASSPQVSSQIIISQSKLP